MNIPWHTQQRTSVERWTKGVRCKKRNWKKARQRQSWSTVQWRASTRPSAAGHGSKEWACYSWPSRVRVFLTSCFLHEKESPCCLCTLPIASRWSLTVGALCSRVPNYYRYAFFRCLFRVANSCAVFFRAPRKWCSLDHSWKERHGFCEIHVRVFLLCDSSEWRVTASGFSIARLSRRDWCICSPCGAAACSASGDPFLHWQRKRIPRDTIDTRGLLNFETFYLTDPRNTDRPTYESLRKKLSDFRKAYMFKVEF